MRSATGFQLDDHDRAAGVTRGYVDVTQGDSALDAVVDDDEAGFELSDLAS